jgi:sec-independent protein translocase protein TatA
MLAMIEGPDLLIVLAIALVLFGGKKLPELARSLGAAKKEFEAGQHQTPTPEEPS